MFQTSILMPFFWSWRGDLFSGDKNNSGFNILNIEDIPRGKYDLLQFNVNHVNKYSTRNRAWL